MPQKRTSRPITVLVVEDDEVDVMAIERGFRKTQIAHELIIARDGLEALALMRGTEFVPRIGKPYIVLLDLNLPRMNGFEFLAAVRNDSELRSTIVFVLTTSKSDEDRARAYSANVAGFVVKSGVGTGFLEMIQMLDQYFHIVELP